MTVIEQTRSTSDPSVRARLARSSASSVVPRLTWCSKRRTSSDVVRTMAKPISAMTTTLTPCSRAQLVRSRSVRPRRGCSPASSSAGMTSSEAVITNVAAATRRSGPCTCGLETAT